MVTAKDKATAGAKKRTFLTPAERVAKAKADYEAAVAKLESKDRKVITDLREKREKIVTRITKDTEAVEVIDRQVAEAEARLTPAAEQDEES